MLRGIEELATENISYTVEKTGNVYDFNTAEKLNQLLIKLLLATGQLAEGGGYRTGCSPLVQASSKPTLKGRGYRQSPRTSV